MQELIEIPKEQHFLTPPRVAPIRPYNNPDGLKRFAKGNPGRPRGIPGKRGANYIAKQKAWDELGEYICNEGAERYINSLRVMCDKDYVNRFEHVLEYFKPKLARSELTGGDGEPLQISLVQFRDLK